jgi:hypothetical protein
MSAASAATARWCFRDTGGHETVPTRCTCVSPNAGLDHGRSRVLFLATSMYFRSSLLRDERGATTNENRSCPAKPAAAGASRDGVRLLTPRYRSGTNAARGSPHRSPRHARTMAGEQLNGLQVWEMMSWCGRSHS